MQIWEISAIELFKLGGPIMIPIILCSGVSFAIILSKLMYFSSIKTDVLKLKESIFELMHENKVKEAISLCDQNPSLVAKILKAGLLKAGASKEEIKQSIDDASQFEIPKLEKHFTALATIAHISPLLGILGTVTGMAGSFYTIQARAAGPNPAMPGDLAGSIFEALLTTVAGLMVAIPTLVAYNYLFSRVNAYILEMERGSSELVNFLGQLSESQLTDIKFKN